MAIRVGINGLGRIGRGFLRDAIVSKDLEVVAVNDVGDPAVLAHLIRHDSLAGRLDRDVRATEGRLVVDGRAIRCTRIPSPARIPWGEAGADLVIEATGCFTARARRGSACGASTSTWLLVTQWTVVIAARSIPKASSITIRIPAMACVVQEAPETTRWTAGS